MAFAATNIGYSFSRPRAEAPVSQSPRRVDSFLRRTYSFSHVVRKSAGINCCAKPSPNFPPVPPGLYYSGFQNYASTGRFARDSFQALVELAFSEGLYDGCVREMNFTVAGPPGAATSDSIVERGEVTPKVLRAIGFGDLQICVPEFRFACDVTAIDYKYLHRNFNE
jgi:hypothetical protein